MGENSTLFMWVVPLETIVKEKISFIGVNATHFWVKFCGLHTKFYLLIIYVALIEF